MDHCAKCGREFGSEYQVPDRFKGSRRVTVSPAKGRPEVCGQCLASHAYEQDWEASYANVAFWPETDW